MELWRGSKQTYKLRFFETDWLEAIGGFEGRAQCKMSLNKPLNKSMVLMLQLQAKSVQCQ